MKTFLIILITLFISEVSHSLQWKQRLNGRSVWSFGVSPQGFVYAGGLTGANSRIWVSYTEGYTWDTIYIGSGQTMWDFAFDSAGAMYVANFSNGLLKSTNGGLNFTVIPSNPNFNGKNLQGVECGSNGYVFVTTSTGFFRSTDHGATFTETALTGLNCLPVVVDKDSSNIIYVGVSSATGTGIGVYRSTDNGLTFSNNLLPNANISGLQLADLIAHSVRRYVFKTFWNLENGKKTFSDKIIEILLNGKFFEYKDKIIGYGLKKLP